MSKQKRKQTRRTHTREFKTDTVALVRTGGRRVAQVARDLGLADSLVRSWVRQADVDAGQGPVGALTTAEKEELSQLRREVKVLRMEREILKRAATFFAKESTSPSASFRRATSFALPPRWSGAASTRWPAPS